MKELQKACLPQHLLCCSRQAFCCFKRYKGIANYFIFLIIASVKALQPRVPPSSPVICPDAKQAAMASSMRCPSSFMPKCFSIMAEDNMAEVGLAKSLPAISGADPCTASNTATPSPRLAPALHPVRLPMRCPDRR